VVAVLMAVRIEISCDSLQEFAEGISLSLLQSIRVQSIATPCKAENAPVNRRVVGSSPTSGAKYRNYKSRSAVAFFTGTILPLILFLSSSNFWRAFSLLP
jgi:hypothetical protein